MTVLLLRMTLTTSRKVSTSVGISYVITKFSTALESLFVYYTITDTSASAWILL
jgi:hypothetical protein